MVMRRTTTTGAATVLAVLALAGCTAPAEEEAATPTATATSTPTATPTPIGPLDLPEGQTAAVTWTDRIGAPEPQTVRLVGEPLSIRLAVACDTADAEVTVEIEGLMTSGSKCLYNEGITRGDPNEGNGASMQISVDQDARIVVTTVPADARWSGTVSTGPRTVPAPG
ncbi:hypothetical protein [Rathayibacter caricis]|uniref:hypothetical protein n=1 Tax=Rathayibacter caricis TaxID=110936 RepID=UPI001FB4FA2D|nr:hypothetical protein [Rathayibacter caricis]